MSKEEEIQPVSSVARAHVATLTRNETPTDGDQYAPSEQGELQEIKPRSKLRLSIIVIALYLALFTAALDQTIVATSIPAITNSLHSSSGFVWIGGAFFLAQSAASPLWVNLSDIWGRKPVLLIAVAAFSASSIVCASATSMNALIIGRAFQGTANGGLIMLVHVTISDIFSLRRRALFLGMLEVMWGVAGGMGPILGGAFSQYLSWRWNFWINLPVEGIAFVLIFIFLDVHNPKTSLKEGMLAIDWAGGLSILGLTVMLMLGLNFGGQTFPWDSPKVICLIVFGLAMSILFVYSEKKLARYPLLPPALLWHRSNAAALLVTFFHGMTFIGAEFYLPLYFQAARHAPPLQSGLLVLPYIVFEALGGIIAGVIIYKTGRYLALKYTGFVLLTVGHGLFITFVATTPLAQLIGLQVIGGLGSGFLFEAPLIAMQAMVKQHEVATATSCIGFARNIATAFGVIIGGVLFQNGMDAQTRSLAKAGLSPELLKKFSGHFAESSIPLIEQITNAAQRGAVTNAYAFALRYLWIFYTCTAGVGLICSIFVAKATVSHEHTETKTGLREKERAKKAQADESTELRSIVQAPT